jgi:PAS domain S-box-containing protein
MGGIMANNASYIPHQAAIVYTLIAALWILLSDTLLSFLAPGFSSLRAFQTLKGLLFVSVTAILLFFLLQKSIQALRRLAEQDLRAESRQQENENLFRSLYDNSAEAMLLTRSNGDIVSANPAACRMFGHTEQALCALGRNGIVEASDPRLAKAIEDRKITGTFSGVMVMKRNDGTRFQGAISINLFHDASGEELTSMVIRDVTALKTYEESIIQERGMYKLLFDANPLPMWVYDIATFEFLAVNDAAIVQYGFSRDEFLSMTIKDIRPIEDVQSLVSSVQSITEGFNTSKGWRHKKKDGTVIDVEISAHTLIFNGKHAELISASDITERKRAEEDVRESESKFRDVFEAANVGKSITLLTGEINVNKTFCSMLGYTKEELKVKKWQDLTPPEEIPFIQKKLELLIQGKKTSTRFEKRYIHKNGTIIWADVSVSLRRDTENRPRYFITTIIDITDHKLAELELHKSHERLKKVLEVETVGVMFWDLTTGCLVDANDTFLKLMGYSRSDVEAHTLTWQTLTPPEYMEISREEIEKFHVSGRVGPYEKEYLHKDGTRRWLIFAGSSLGGNMCVEFCVDIDDRKKAESALRESEEKFSILFEKSAFIATLSRLPDGILVAVNEAFEQSFGFTKREALGKSTKDLGIHPDVEGRARIMGLLDQNKSVRNLELSLRTKAGEQRMYSVNVDLVKIGDQQYILNTAQDISSRIEAERAVHQSEERYRTIVSNIPGGLIHIFDREMRYVFNAGEELTRLGLSNEFLVGKSIHDVLPEETAAIVETNYKRVLTGETVQFEGHYGDDYFSLISAPLRNAIGEIEYILTLSVNITHRKQMELHLADSEKRYRTLFENMTAGFVLFEVVFNDQENPVDLRILAANSRFEETTGLTLQNAIGKRLTQVLPGIENDEADWIGTYSTVAITGESRQFERGSDLLGVYYSVNAFRTGPMQCAVTFVDITDRKRAEEQLLQLNAELEWKVQQRTFQLEASNKDLEAFSYTVSHDLRAPLRHINGYVELLNERFRDDLPEKARHYLASITDASKHMGAMIDDLLRFSRTGRQELVMDRLDMNILVRDVLNNVVMVDSNRDISWNIQHLPAVNGDASLLKLVWTNLLDNAVKYTRNNSSTEITVGYTEEEHRTIFFVRDNGVGFDMKYADKLFGVFQRLHSLDEFEGNGIGLAGVRRIIRKHKGEVWADAQPGKGATLFFSLPKFLEEQ